MKQAHRPLFQRRGLAHEPITVGAFDLDIEQPRQPPISRPAQVIVVHDGDTQPLRRSLEHQLTGIEMVDRRRLEIRKADCRFPRGKTVRQFIVHEERLLRQRRAVGLIPDPFLVRGAADGMDLVVVEPDGMQPACRAARQDDRGVQRITHPVFEMRAGVDVDMQQRVPRAQFDQLGKQTLRSEQRQDAQMHAQQGKVVRLRLDRTRQRF